MIFRADPSLFLFFLRLFCVNSEVFINQLVKLGPKHIIYVSCNVHTQARDVGQLIRASPDYEILSIRGADLFPQTQ